MLKHKLFSDWVNTQVTEWDFCVVTVIKRIKDSILIRLIEKPQFTFN